MISYRNRFREILQRRRADRMLFVSRLDFWHAAALKNNLLPAECENLSIPQIEAMLEMGRSARFRGFHSVHFPQAEITETLSGDTRTTRIEFKGRRLTELCMQTAEEKQLSMHGHVTEYFLKSAGDYDLMAALWEESAWRVDQVALRDFDRATGEAGLPMLVSGPAPVDLIMIFYAGYENFFLHLADFPDKVSRLREVIEKRYEALWPEMLKSPAELVLHGVHWSTAMTPPSVFRAHILPYMRRFTLRMREGGKHTAFHADADLSGLLPEIAESGVDVADCFACAPLVNLTLSEARRSWKEKVIIWGGLPSTIFLPSCPRETFRQCLDNFLGEARDGRAIIAGVSDNLMPGSSWERLKEAAGRIAELKVEPAFH